MKFFIKSVICMCLFVSVVPDRIDASDTSSHQPKKKGSLKKLLSRRSTLPSIAESPQHATVVDGGLDLDHKHNEDAGAESRGVSSAIGQNAQVAPDEVVDGGSGDRGFFSLRRKKKNAQVSVLQQSDAAAQTRTNQPVLGDTLPAIRASQVHPMWLQNQGSIEQASPKTPKSGTQLTMDAGQPVSTFVQAENDECDNYFVQPSPVDTFFKQFVSKLLHHEQADYRNLFYLDSTSSLKGRTKAEYRSFCHAQTVLRRAVAVAYGLTTEQHEKYRQDMARCHAEITRKTQEARDALEQEKEAFTASCQQEKKAFDQAVEQRKQEMASQAAQANKLLQQQKDIWNQQVERDKLTTKKRTYALCIVTAISLSSMGWAWACLRGKSVHPTTA